MAFTSSTHNNNSATAPFSYAEAAKVKTSQTSHQTPFSIRTSSPEQTSNAVNSSNDTTNKFSLSWADDAADANTVVEDRAMSQSNSNDDGRLRDRRAQQDDLPTNDNKVDNSHISSPSVGPVSSSTTAKEEDSSPLEPPNDHAWTHAQSPNGKEPVEAKNSHVSSKSDASIEAEKANTSAKSLREAPAPAVNFWAQRAREAEAKQASQSAPVSTNSIAGFGRPNPGFEREPTNGMDATGYEKGSGIINGSLEDRHRRYHGSNVTNVGTRSSRHADASNFRKDQAPRPDISLRTLSVSDTASWPTPEKMQDETRKRSSDKVEKPEAEKTAGTASKSHGRTGWVPIPFTPTVKFETPLPVGGKRGGRINSRGAKESMSRRGASSDNSARPQSSHGPPSFTTGDHDSNQTSRGASSPARSSSLPTKARRPTYTGLIQPEQETPRRPSVAKNGDIHEIVPAVVESWSYASNTKPILENDVSSERLTHPQRTRNGSGENTKTIGSGTSRQTGLEMAFGEPQPNATRQQARDGIINSKEPANNFSAASRGGNGKSTFDGQSRGQKSSRNERRAENQTAPNDFVDSYPGAGNFGVREQHGAHSDRSQGGREQGTFSGYANNHGAFTYPQYAYAQGVPMFATPFYYDSHAKSAFTFSQGQSHSAGNGRGYRHPQRSGTNHADNFYARSAPAYSHQNQPSPYLQNAYDQAAMPQAFSPSAMTYLAPMALMNGVANQLNYYFSVDNLCKDMFLRKFMDSQGFVPLTLIAEFKRMKDLTPDLDLIRYVGSENPDYEMRTGRDGKERIRKREGWENFVLNEEDRDPSARNSGPANNDQAMIQYPHYLDTSMMMSSPMLSSENPFTANAMLQSPAAFEPGASRYPFPVSDMKYTAKTAKNTSEHVNGLHEPPNKTSSVVDTCAFSDDNDSFPDDKVDVLAVVVRPKVSSPSQTPVQARDTRTFSNGSIDARTPIDEVLQTEDRPSRSPTRTNGSTLEASGSAQSTKTSVSRTPSGRAEIAGGVTLFWLKHSDRPELQLSGVESEPYQSLRMKALRQRETAAPGTCPYDMEVLYKFWSHFLIRNFNTRMYEEFRQCAHDDKEKSGLEAGMTSLIEYYGEALNSQNTIRNRVAEDYVRLVKEEDASKNRQALKQLRSSWRNGALNFKNRKRIAEFVDAELRAELDQ